MVSVDTIGKDECAELLASIETQFRGGAPAKQIDQRRNVRRPFAGRITVQPCDPQGRILAAPLEGRAIDISLWGLQFTTSKRLEIGQFLALGFCLQCRGKERTAVMLSEVKHIQAKQPEGWTVGCEFRETLCSTQEQ